VNFDAHDIMGEIDVTVEVYPDAAAGYRLGLAEAGGATAELPNLYNLHFTGETNLRFIPERPAGARGPQMPAPASLPFWHRIWKALTGL